MSDRHIVSSLSSASSSRAAERQHPHSHRHLVCLTSAWYEYNRCLLHNVCLPADGRVAIVWVASGRVCLKVIRLLCWAAIPVILVKCSCCSSEGKRQEKCVRRLTSGAMRCRTIAHS